MGAQHWHRTIQADWTYIDHSLRQDVYGWSTNSCHWISWCNIEDLGCGTRSSATCMLGSSSKRTMYRYPWPSSCIRLLRSHSTALGYQHWRMHTYLHRPSITHLHDPFWRHTHHYRFAWFSYPRLVSWHRLLPSDVAGSHISCWSLAIITFRSIDPCEWWLWWVLTYMGSRSLWMQNSDISTR